MGEKLTRLYTDGLENGNISRESKGLVEMKDENDASNSREREKDGMIQLSLKLYFSPKSRVLFPPSFPLPPPPAVHPPHTVS